MVTIINGNRVFLDKEDTGFWRVESATGEWDGYELYSTRREAEFAAQLPNDDDYLFGDEEED